MEIVKKDNWKKVVEYLKNGKIVAYPTDTVYGLAVIFNNLKTKEYLIKVKNRPKEKSFPVMVSDINMLKSIAITNEKIEKVIKKFMPGPLTIILKKQDYISYEMTNFKDTIAIRMASDETIYKIIDKLKSPIFLTSANKSDFPVCKNVEEIEKYELCDLAVDDIPKQNIASTIIDLSDKNIKILREGPINIKEIIEVYDE